MRNKIFSFVAIFISIIAISTYVLADYSNVIMSVVDKPVCSIEFTENSGFTKQLVSADLNNKEVTIELKATNDEVPSTDTITKHLTGELVLVLDDSRSMEDPAMIDENDGASDDDIISRLNVLKPAACELVNNLMNNNSDLEVGVVRFSTLSGLYEEMGTLGDSSTICPLTNSKTDVITAINSLESTVDHQCTNIQSGLIRASSLFSSEENNKNLVLITDGVPNVCVLNDPTDSEERKTKVMTYNQTIIDITKGELEDVADSNVNLITLFIEAKDPQEQIIYTTNPDAPVYTYGGYAQLVFGTEENPTYGKLFNAADADVYSIITEDILDSLIATETVTETKTLSDIKIVDVFPEYIVNNFDIEPVGEPNFGTIDLQYSNRKLTWTIPSLRPGDVATYQYKLKLKQSYSSDILNKVLATNEKVDIDYKDFDDKDESKESEVSPHIKLEEPLPVLPNTGSKAILSLLAISASLTILFVIKFIKNR